MREILGFFRSRLNSGAWALVMLVTTQSAISLIAIVVVAGTAINILAGSA